MNIRRFLNPVLMVTLILITISGFLLFFNIKSNAIKFFHVYGSFVFTVVMIAHILINKKGLSKTLGNTSNKIILSFIILAAIVVMGVSEKRKPRHSIVEQIDAVTEVKTQER